MSALMQQEKSCIIQMSHKKESYKPQTVAQMKAKTPAEKAYYENVLKQQSEGSGMDCFPIEVYNKLIEYTVSNEKYRDAMFLICMSNWGMRIGDVLRVRYCYIFDDTGNFKESFTLPKGEQKTGKKNIYYNNEAVMRAIEMYLSQPENCNKCSYDYMFVGESGNGKKVIEDGISIKAPMSKTSATDIILNALEAIGIYPINRKDKSKDVNLDVKLNTHSLRKMFCEFFYITGLKLKCNAELYFDNEVFKLSQDKFMHSKAAITRHYNGAEEKAFRQICLAMNIGLDALENL